MNVVPNNGHTPSKPTLRGVLHQWSIPAAFGAGAVLVSMARSSQAAVAAGVFAASLVVLFAVSATYHRVDWSPVARARMRRLDHASIFVLIAGTYTPIAMLGLSGEQGHRLLWSAWIAAGVGIARAVFWIGAPKAVSALVAVAAGWAVVPYVGDVRAALDSTALWLILAGGAAYTLGAVAYATQKPNVREGVFGYHEVFHALTIVGAGLHFAAVMLFVRDDAARECALSALAS